MAIEKITGSAPDDALRNPPVAASVLDDSYRDESRFDEHFRRTPAMLHSIGTDGCLLTVSERWLDTLGYTRDEVIGRPSTDFLTEESRHRAAAELRNFFENGYCDDVSYQMVCRSGRIIDVLLSAVLERDPHGAPLRSLAVCLDVTERLRAERALGEERWRLAAIIDATGAGTWEWQVDSGEMHCNERAAEIVGRRAEDVPGRRTLGQWLEEVHPEDRARMRERLTEHLEGHSTRYECEMRVRHRAGHWVWVHDQGRVQTYTSEGGPEWVFGTRMEITDRKRQEESLRRRGQLLDRTGEIGGVGGWELDVAAGALRWTAQTRRIHEVAEDYRPVLDEAIGFYAPEARPVVRAALDQALSDGEGWDLQLPFVTARGRRLWVRAVGSAERDERGRVARLYGAFQDITEEVDRRRALEGAHQRVLGAVESGRIGVWIHDRVDDSLVWDKEVRRLHGTRSGSEPAKPAEWGECLHPDDGPELVRAVEEAVDRGTSFDLELRVPWRDGSVRHLRVTGRASDEERTCVSGTCRDITDLKRRSDELSGRHELLQVTLQSIGDAVITTDTVGQITWLNPVAERLTGWSEAEASGRRLGEVFHIVHETTRLRSADPALAALGEDAVIALAPHTLLLGRDGAEFAVEDSASPIRDREGRVLGVVLVFHDVTEQRRLSGEMNYRATHDALTGLVNRAEFEVRLSRALAQAEADGSEHALLLIDLDRFKAVNDGGGHAAGDRLLQQLARLFEESVRTGDTVARLGGDEFGVLLEHCGSDRAERIAETICSRVAALRFVDKGRRFEVGASIGLVPLDARWSDIATALGVADEACYAAKHAGSGQVRRGEGDAVTASGMSVGDDRAQRLERALAEGKFALHAQRVYALQSEREALSAEVLLRLVGEEDSEVPADAFLPDAERYHLASRIDAWVLRRTLETLARFDLARVELIGINLSARSLSDRAFQAEALAMFESADVAVRHCLCLEIDESAVIADEADIASFVRRVRALGVRVALDDFGSAGRALDFLRRMPVDVLKIDPGLIGSVDDHALEDVALRSFADLASVTGAVSVAKGIEHEGVLARLGELRIDQVQGHRLHRPEPLETVLTAAIEERAESWKIERAMAPGA